MGTVEWRWGKNSKYFPNLEKRNHIRKHIRKLRLSGVIITDPLKILEVERDFYEKLYKSRRDCSKENDPNLRFKDLLIQTLSPESNFSSIFLCFPSLYYPAFFQFLAWLKKRIDEPCFFFALCRMLLTIDIPLGNQALRVQPTDYYL